MDEDGIECLTLLNLRYWRDIAVQYKQDKKQLDSETRIRIFELVDRGEDDALTKKMDGPSKDKKRAFTIELDPGESMKDLTGVIPHG